MGLSYFYEHHKRHFNIHGSRSRLYLAVARGRASKDTASIGARYKQLVSFKDLDLGFCLKDSILVISTERRNHTRESAKRIVNLCRVSSAISPFSGNDKLIKTLIASSFSWRNNI